MKLIDIIDGTRVPLSYRLSFLTAFMREPLLRRMEKEHGLIRPEWTVLVTLTFRDGSTARDICEVTEQPSNTVSRGVASLLRQGMITKKRDPDDARRTQLYITPEGQRVHDAIMDTFVEVEQRMVATLTQEEHVFLLDVLGRMARNVESWTENGNH